MFQPKISSIRKLFKLIEEGCPFKIRAVHILNTVGFLDLILGKNNSGLESEIAKNTAQFQHLSSLL